MLSKKQLASSHDYNHGDIKRIYQAVLDTLHMIFLDQSYVTSAEAVAANFVIGF